MYYDDYDEDVAIAKAKYKRLLADYNSNPNATPQQYQEMMKSFFAYADAVHAMTAEREARAFSAAYQEDFLASMRKLDAGR